jgi:hypothetical protein
LYPTTSTAWPPRNLSLSEGIGTIPVADTCGDSKEANTANPITKGYPAFIDAFIE